MAEKKVHKKEKPNVTEPTPQVKKAKDLRGAGHSLHEISEMLNIPRKRVEEILTKPKVLAETKTQIENRQAIRRAESVKRGDDQRKEKAKTPKKGK